MDSIVGEITHEFPPLFRVYKDGRVERLMVSDYVAPAVDPKTGVEFKDIVIFPETGVIARVFLPKIRGSDRKLPLIVHYHGGGFCVGSALDSITLRFIASLASEAQAIAVSVEYRLAPEHPLPIAYDDSWATLQWIAAHSNGQGPEPWINLYADLGRVFLMGESAGANIAHAMSVRVGSTGLTGLMPRGLIVVHPYFAGNESDKMIMYFMYLYPGSSGLDSDPKLNPKADPDLKKMGCNKVLVYVAGKDRLKPRGVSYFETLKNSEWEGAVELMESEGEDHCFHMFNPASEKFVPFMKKMVAFVNDD